MCGTLSIWLLALALLAVTVGYWKKRGKMGGRTGNPAASLMLFGAAGYFFTVSKTALLLGETSNRYQLPVYGILCFLLLYGGWSLVESLMETMAGKKTETGNQETGGKRKGSVGLEKTLACLLAQPWLQLT